MKHGKWMICVLALIGICPGVSAETTPAGFWPLVDDGRDYSGQWGDAVNHGAVFSPLGPDGPPARFNGRDAYFEAPGRVPFGADDFSLLLWIHTQDVLDDGLGDLLSNFDATSRKGFTLGLATYTGVSNSQPNYRTLHFGLDDGTEPAWTDCGRPGNAVFVFGFAVHDGALYAATCEPGENEAGQVYRYAGGTDWTDCGNPDRSNAVMALAAHDGHLYAGTGWYDTTGSALEASPNTTPGGKVYRYDGDGNWTFCGALSNPETGEAGTLGGLGVYKGALYATTLKQAGFGLYRYDGGTDWTYCGNPGRRVLNPAAFNGDLYMVSYDGPGGPFRYNGAEWAYVGGTLDPPISQDYSFAVYDGRLHLSTWPEAHVYRMEDSGAWRGVGRPAGELETMGMMVYNGKLYVGTLPSSRVYRYDGENRWTAVGEPLDAAGGKYRRAWSMALYQGKLFCGTLPSGKVWSLQAGGCVTYDHALAPGWRHLAAVRQGRSLLLYVDGAQVAAGTLPDDSPFDVSSDTPLQIGRGPGDYFNGYMRNLQAHTRALSEAEIKQCYDKDKRFTE